MNLGVLHPDYLLERLTMRQMVGWMAYHSLEPFSPVEAVVGQILDGLSDTKKPTRAGIKPLKKKRQNPEEMKRLFDSIFFGGDPSKRKKAKEK